MGHLTDGMSQHWIPWTLFTPIVGSMLNEFAAAVETVRSKRAFPRNEHFGLLIRLRCYRGPRCVDRRDRSPFEGMEAMNRIVLVDQKADSELCS